MTDKKTVNGLIDEANMLYNRGEWNAASEILEKARKVAQKTIQHNDELMTVICAIEMHKGWISWKKGDKQNAAITWETVMDVVGDEITRASIHAGLGIYYAEKKDKEKTLKHARLAQYLLPEDATSQQNKNLNACGIAVARIGELNKAEEILRKVAQINEQLIKSDDPEIAREAIHQRGKNGYNLASLVYIPQKRFYEAIKELEEEVIPHYEVVGAETDLAAAYHRVAEVNEKIAEGDSHSTVNITALNLALSAEEKSLTLWRKHSDDPKRVETAEENLKRIKEKIQELKQ